MLAVLGSASCAKHEPLVLKGVEECTRQNPLFEKEIYHIVEKGETLYGISKTYGVNLEEIIRANGIEDPTQISLGQTIIIPGHKTLGLIWPIEGKISSRFGRRGFAGFHSGIDIPAPKGTPIRAAADGLVVSGERSLDGYSGYGRIVVIEHGGGIRTLYAHNSENRVRAGECVRAGEIVGEVGSTGNATGAHLHFEIRKDGKPIDPLKYLP